MVLNFMAQTKILLSILFPIAPWAIIKTRSNRQPKFPPGKWATTKCTPWVCVFSMPYVTFIRTVHSFLGWHQLLQYYYQGQLKILPSPLSSG